MTCYESGKHLEATFPLPNAQGRDSKDNVEQGKELGKAPMLDPQLFGGDFRS